MGVLIVTGGGRGIGAAVAQLAARSGFAVAVNYAERADAAQSVVAAIRQSGGQALAIQGDVAVEADVLRLFAETEREFGPVTALVNNAGITGPATRVDAVEAAMLERLFAINVVGTILCSREAARRMSKLHGGNGGAIVNIGSRAADLGAPGEWVHYAASKGAIDSFTRGFAREVAAEGIRVNTVSPGLIDTEIHAGGAPDRLEKLIPNVPMKRVGSALEVAQAVVWLLSPQSSYVTGANIDTSGGR